MSYKNKFTNKELIKGIGMRIFVLRILKGLNRRELAARVGLQEKQILQYETGEERIPVDELIHIPLAMNLKIINLSPIVGIKY